MLNIVALMGRLVAEPELKKTPNGVSVCACTIACERSYVKPGAERQTDFIDLVAWRGTAEFINKYFRKGQLIGLNGSLQTRTYEDKEGKKRKVYEIIAEQVHFADGKRSEEANQAYTAPSPDNEQALDISDNEDLPF